MTLPRIVPFLAAAAATALVACGGGQEAGPVGTTPGGTTPGGGTTPPAATLTVTSSGVVAGALPVAYTCDGTAQSPPLAWSGAPANTAAYALLFTTIPTQGTTKYNWLLYNIPAGTTSIPAGGTAGTAGFADDGGGLGYAAPCSQGPGLKTYTFTVVALSAPVNVGTLTPQQVTGAALTAALAPLTLASGSLSVGVTRTTAMIHCGYIRASINGYRAAYGLDVTCDSTYAYVSTTGIQWRHPMMNGITATNQQVPIPQNFTGANAWKIPLVPAVAATKTSALDGPIGVAVNGVPIFNPCKQGGCSGPGGGDTKVLGELDACNGHAGRADDYHYHAAPVCMMSDQNASYWDTHPLGWALDGYAIFGYRNPDGTVATRDATCGGNTVTHPNAPAGYAYHVTDASPYVLSCFHGVPSPDLAGQGGKYAPVRPPGTPMQGVSAMTLTTSQAALAVGGSSTMTWTGGGKRYEIRYARTSATCWTFTFLTDGAQTASTNYCRSR